MTVSNNNRLALMNTYTSEEFSSINPPMKSGRGNCLIKHADINISLQGKIRHSEKRQKSYRRNHSKILNQAYTRDKGKHRGEIFPVN